jgi:diguanylate cyclase (GGDEF)-like protein
MQDAARPARRWRYSAGFIVPIVLAVTAALSGVGGFVVWSSNNNDTRAIARETQLISNALAEDLSGQVTNQEQLVVSDEAYDMAVENFDRGWVDSNLGIVFYDTYGYEQAYVIDPEDQPIYAMQDGVEVQTSRTPMGDAGFAPLITKMREKLAEGELKTYYMGGSATAPYVSDILTIAGIPAQVTVMPIVPIDTPDGSLTEGQYLHIAVEYLDADYAEFFARQYLLTDAALRATPSANSEKTALPILNQAGRIMSFLEWTPDRPGRRMLIETVPVLAAALAIALLLIIGLLVRLWRYSTALETGRAEAQYRAYHDALTGLPNRAMFEASLAETLVPKPGPATGFALMMLDLDRFKQVNDTFGHPAGDELIRAVGKRLQNVVQGGTIFRLGGDEFGVIVPAVTDETQVSALAARMIETITRPFELHGNEASVGASIGIVLADSAAGSGAELVRKADIALYEAKAAGRERSVIYRPRMDESVQRRHTLEADLRESLRHTRQVTVAFEPIVDAASGRIVGAEAHPRWVHPRHGEVDPLIFVPIAESAGMGEMLYETVMRKAALIGGRRPNRSIAIAVSPAMLRNPKFFNKVFDILADTGLRPGNLEMLVPEAVLADPQGSAAEALRKLHSAGVCITIDNFGTGCSALSATNHPYVSSVRMLPAGTGEQTASVAILKAVGNLVRTMGITVTGKAITTPEQAEMMRQLGCTTLQGSAISRTLAADALEDLFEGAEAQKTKAAVA